MKRILTLLTSVLLISFSGFSQTDTAFWFVAPEVVYDHGDGPTFFRLATFDEPATVTFSFPAQPNFRPIAPITIPANSAYTVDLLALNLIDTVENIPFDKVLNKGIKITSTANITAYYEVLGRGQRNPSNPVHNSDLFALKGSKALGLKFYIPFQNIFNNASQYDAWSSFDIVATEDGTIVTIDPTADIMGFPNNINGHPKANGPYSIVLNKGQTYSARAVTKSSSGRLSGTKVTSNKPIAITNKDDSMQFGGSRDIAGDQLIPVENIGVEYIVVKGELVNYNKAYIVATEANTQIFLDGSKTSTVSLNEKDTFSINIVNGATHILASKPIYVYYVSGFGTEVGGAIIPSIKCTGSSRITITRSTNDAFYLTLMVPKGGEGGFQINGNSNLIPASSFFPVPGKENEWLYAQLQFTEGQIPVGIATTISNTTSPFHMGVINGNGGSSARFGFFSDFGKLSTSLPKEILSCNGPVKLDPKVFKPYSTQWEYNGNLINTSDTITATESGKYTVHISDVRGCSVSASVDVKINPPTTLDLGVDKNICWNQPSPITVPPGFAQVVWKAPQGVTIRNGTLTHDPKNSGLYKVTVTHANGCSATDSVNVNYVEDFKFKLNTLDIKVCFNTPHTLTSEDPKFKDTSKYNWRWNAPTGVSIPEDQTSHTPTATGNYRVTITDKLTQCSASDVAYITFVPDFKFDLPSQFPVCANNPLPIEIEGDFNDIRWVGPTGVSITNGTNSYIPEKAGIYTVTVIDANNCQATDAVNVSLIPNLNLDLGGTFQTICANDAKPIVVNNDYHKIIWTTNNEITIPEGLKEYTPTKTGTYTVTVSDTNNCSDQKSVNVNFIGDFNFDLLPNQNIFCFNESNRIRANESKFNNTGIYNWKWTTDNGVAISENTISHEPKKSGKYIVRITQGECFDADTVDVTYIPNFNFDLGGNNQTFCLNSPIPIKATDRKFDNLANYSWTWKAPTGENIPNNQTEHLPKQSGTYIAAVKDVNDCVSSDTVNIKYVGDLAIGLNKPGNPVVCFSDNYVINVNPTKTYETIAWFFNNKRFNPTNPLKSHRPDTAGIFKVVVTSQGCRAADSVDVKKFVKPFGLNLGDTISVCNETTFNLDAGPKSGPLYSQYIWATNVPGVAVPGPTERFFNLQNKGKYSVKVIDADGCFDQDTVDFVRVNELPLNLGGDSATSCNGEAYVIKPGVYSKYEWSTNVPGVTLPGTDISQFKVPATGKYAVKVYDGTGCDKADTIHITLAPRIPLDLGHNDTIACYYSNYIIKGPWNPNYTYVWSPNVPSGTLNEYPPTTKGWYSLKIVDQYKCSVADSVNVNYIEKPNLNLGDEPLNICWYSNAFLETKQGFKSYRWVRNADTLVSFNNKYRMAPDSSGQYKVFVVDAFGCKASDTIQVSYSPKFPGNFGKDSLPACWTLTEYIMDYSKIPNIVSVNWTGPGAPTNTTTFSFMPNTSGIFTAKVTDNNNCSATKTVDLTYIPQFTIPDWNKDTICGNAPDTLKAGPVNEYTYLWHDGSTKNYFIPNKTETVSVKKKSLVGNCEVPASSKITFVPKFNIGLRELDIICPEKLSHIITAQRPGLKNHVWQDGHPGSKYNVKQGIEGLFVVKALTEVGNCPVSDSIEIKRHKIIPIDLGNDTLICNYNKFTIDAGPWYKTYKWTPNDSDSSTIFTSDNAKYEIMVIDSNDCKQHDSIKVHIVPIQPTKITDRVYCSEDEDRFLRPQGQYDSFKWIVFSGEVTTPVYQPVQGDSLITLIVTKSNSIPGLGSKTCYDTSKVIVQVLPQIKVEIQNSKPTFCSFDLVPLEAKVIQGVGPFSAESYSWFMDGKPVYTGQNYFPKDSGSHTYTVQVTGKNECIGTASKDSIYYFQYNTPVLSPDTVCAGVEGSLSLRPEYFNYWWYDEGGALVDSIKSTFTTAKPGIYKVVTEHACKRRDEATSQIVINSIPQFDLLDSTSFCIDAVIPNYIKPENIDSTGKSYVYNWRRKDDTTFANNNIVINPIDPDIYYFIVGDEITKCFRRDSIIVDIDESCFKIPNLITPNGDSLNDNFRILGIRPNTWQLEIYNRWGDLVYKNSGYNNDWGGSNVSDGVYYYVLRNPRSTKDPIKGWLQVIGKR